MLTQKIVFGMNLLSVLGFAIIAISLALGHRPRRSVAPWVIRNQVALVLMIAGTVLVCCGIYLTPPLFP